MTLMTRWGRAAAAAAVKVAEIAIIASVVRLLRCEIAAVNAARRSSRILLAPRGSSFSSKSFAFLSALLATAQFLTSPRWRPRNFLTSPRRIQATMDAIADTFSLAFHTSPLLSGIALTAAVWYVLVTLRTMSSGKVAASAASGVQREEAMLRARELQQQRLEEANRARAAR